MFYTRRIDTRVASQEIYMKHGEWGVRGRTEKEAQLGERRRVLLPKRKINMLTRGKRSQSTHHQLREHPINIRVHLIAFVTRR